MAMASGGRVRGHATADPSSFLMTPAHAVPRPPTPPRSLPVLLVMYALAGLLATDTYLPSMPHLQDVFGTTEARVQFTMTVYFLGVAVANLFYGPLSDKYGRRPVLLFGGVAFLLATLVCASATSIEILTVGRFAQGASVCSLTVTSRATVRELYDDTSVTRINAYIAMAEGLAPAIGPVIGAEVLIQLGWRWNFYGVVLLAGAALMALYIKLPESNVHRNARALMPGPLLRVYGQLLVNRNFIGPVLAAGFVFGGLMLYIVEAPFMLIERMGLSERQYGMTQAVIVCFYIAAMIGTSRLIGVLGARPLLAAGLLAIAGGGVSMLVLALAGYDGFLAFVAPFAIYTFGIGIAMAPMLTRALSSNRSATGSVAALLGTITMSFAFLGTQTITMIRDGTTLPVAWAMCVISLCALVTYAITEFVRFTRPA